MRPNITPVVRNLLILNIAVFILWLVAGDQDWVYEYFLLWKSDLIFQRMEPAPPVILDRPDSAVYAFLPIQIITSVFSHKEIWHIAMNMLALVSFGSLVELAMGGKRFLAFYLFCGIFGSAATSFLDPSPNPVLGASGALFGVMVALAYYYPGTRLGIMFLPFQFKARPFVAVLGGISAVFVVMDFLHLNYGGRISHFGHLAGMVGAIIILFGNQFTGIFRKRS